MACARGINNCNLKQENRGLLLKLIATGRSNTRIDLAKQTGLSKMTVSNVVGAFMEEGVVRERTAEPAPGQGRNPITLSISESAPKVVGVNIHRTECVAVLSDLGLRALKTRRLPLHQDNSADLLSNIFRLTDAVLSGQDRHKVLGIGVGTAGPVDMQRGVILHPPDFYGIRDFPVVRLLEERYGLPVAMDSQYNCAAMAERYYGVGRNWQDFIFVGLMKGIGSGIVSGGSILHHENGFTSELGHVSVDWRGRPCECGNRGCLETYAGSEIIRDRLAAATGRRLSFRAFCELAERAPVPEMEGVFTDMTEALACALTSAVNLLNSEAVILGHDGYFLPERYLKLLETRINAQKLSGDYRHVRAVRSGFRNEAHIRGCPCVILNRVFDGTMRI